MRDDIKIDKPYAEIYEIKMLHPDNNTNEFRVWCSQWPEVYTLQIRTHKPITTHFKKKGKPRNMIAHVDVSIEEMEKVLEMMKRNAAPRTKAEAVA